MQRKAKAPQEETKGEKFIKAPAITREKFSQSTSDFEENFKPLFEAMDAWRKESASSQIKVT